MDFLKKLLFQVVIILLSVGVSSAGVVTSPPTLMPNFPMLAGENVMIMWVPVPGAVKYRIYQNGEPVGEAPVPPFTVPAPAEPGVYKYTISGVDATGVEGPHSREGALSIIPLIQPAGIAARFLGEVLNIRWDAVPNAVIYDIYRSDSKEGPFKLIASVTGTRYVDADIKQTEKFYGKKLYYKIVSKDKFAKSSPDTEIFEYKVPTPPPREKKPGIYTLRIQRSKEVAFIKPPGLQSCYDAAFLSDGESLVYVDTFACKVAVINSAGKELRTIGSAGIRPDQYAEPIRLAIDKNDDIYILDIKKPKIFVYTSDGEFKTAFDIHTIDETEVISIHQYNEPLTEPVIPKLNAILIYGDRIYAADKLSGTIQIYSKSDGSFIDYYKKKETGEIIYFGAVSKMLISEDSKLYIAKPLRREIAVMDVKTGEELYYVGRAISVVGRLFGVNGMVFDKKNGLLVSDDYYHSVQVFNRKNGEYMHAVGGEKAVLDRYYKSWRAGVDLDYPGAVNFDSKWRLWIYKGIDKGFTVREYIGDNIWDYKLDKPEGSDKHKK